MSKLDLVQYDLNSRPPLALNEFDPAIRDDKSRFRAIGRNADDVVSYHVGPYISLRDARGGAIQSVGRHDERDNPYQKG